jgi:hypothetical protein
VDLTQFTDYLNRLGTNEESDECYTPSHEVAPLCKFLKKSYTYYEATSGKSSSLLVGLREMGVSIEPSGDKDFFDCTPADVLDGVITNPPYSKKDAFIEHCYYLGKPFALLLPVAAFQGQKRGKLFKEKGISALVYNRRIDFTGKKSPTFGVAWFMYGFDEGGRLYFADN